MASIGLLKAIAATKGLLKDAAGEKGRLNYTYRINKKYPLELKIYGMIDKTISENGFIYLINKTNELKNIPKNS